MIKLDNISKYYNYGMINQTTGVENISLSIKDGEMVAIMGPSGSGKSTLLKILSGGSVPQKGKFYFGDIDVYALSEIEISKLRNEQIGIIMQDFALIDEYNVIENILIPHCFNKKYKSNKKYLNEKINEALKEVGLNNLKNKLVYQLSGGEKQRVAIARVIAQDTKVILADEPTGALDESNSIRIMQLLKELNKKGKTIIIVTHNEKIANYCDKVINIFDGHID